MYAWDEKARYVNFVLDILIESRFGPGRVDKSIIKLSDRPELEQAVFYDLTDAGMIPCYALSPVGRNGYQLVEMTYRRSKRKALANNPPRKNSAASSIANQGRGSPDGFKTHAQARA